jgi:hypothetical protein
VEAGASEEVVLTGVVVEVVNASLVVDFGGDVVAVV